MTAAIALAGCVAGATTAQRLETVADGLDRPLQLTHAGDDRLFVVLQGGQVRIVEDGVLRSEPFLDISDRVLSGGERGLLGLAFDPGYAANGRFYVDYTRTPDGATIVSRFTVGADPDRADATSEAVLLEIAQPFSNHNGGQLAFGPDDLLYVGVGDGGSANDPQCFAQRTDTLLGKMLRIDPSGSSAASPFYAIPADNPFVGPGGPADEVWATGLRNPYRFSFDRVSGDLFIGDVGQNAREEIDLASPGASGLDFGWKVFEGTLCLGSTSGCPDGVEGCSGTGYTPPILEYSHATGDCSVTGGFVYRGSDLPELAGDYLYGDFCSGRIRAARRAGASWTSRVLDIEVPNIAGFGEDQGGELYLLSLFGPDGGVVYRLAPEAQEPPADGGVFTVLGPAALELGEDSGSTSFEVARTESFDGTVSVQVAVKSLGAEEGTDFTVSTDELSWSDGDDTSRTVTVTALDDARAETDEAVELRLASPSPTASIGADDRVQITLLDDERRAPCGVEFTTLCLRGGRFAVRAHWTTAQGTSGDGVAVDLTADTGTFWFFEEDNVELAVKVLDACEPFDRFWVFAAGLTDVGVELSVVDTATEEISVYGNPLGTAFLPVTDTDAFATCPQSD